MKQKIYKIVKRTQSTKDSTWLTSQLRSLSLCVHVRVCASLFSILSRGIVKICEFGLICTQDDDLRGVIPQTQPSSSP